MTKFLHLSLLICCLAAHCLVALCGPRDRRFREIKTIKDNIAALQRKFDELKASVEQPEGGAIERCGSNQIKFTFSGDDGKAKHDDHDDHGHHDHHDDHSHHDDHGHDEDVHVNVNLRFEDFHHGGIYGPIDDHNHKHSAHCKLGKGDVYITQNAYDRFAKFKFSLNSLDLDELDVHVHESGDLSENCKSLGGHYDPIDKDRDVGDLGTIQTDGKEDITAWFNDTKLSLVGPHSILGRSIVGHDRSGKRLICCVIGRAADDHDHHGHSHHGHGSHDDHDHKGDDHDHKGDDHHYP